MKVVKFNQNQYRNDYKRLHHSCEQQQYRPFKAALDEQTNSVKDYVQRHGVKDIPLSVLISKQPIQKAYKNCYQRVGVQGATFTYNQIEKIANGTKSASLQLETKEHPTAFFSEYWRKLMSLFYETDGGSRITKVTETTKEKVMQVISDSQDLPISQQADYIVAQLDDPDFNRNRALVIARTETTTASNRGAFLGSQSSDYQTAKSWLSILDMNTRPAHVAANGQVVDLDDVFIVGGEPLLYPGDISGSAANIIQCRCCVCIVPMADDSGLPLRKSA